MTDPTVRKVFTFCNGLGDVDKSVAFPRKRGEIRRARKGYTGLVSSFWESCLLWLSSASVLGNLQGEVTSWCAGPIRV